MSTDILLDNGADRIISAFESENFSIYAVGGCVRDAILNRPASDIDLATSAAPDQIMRVFKENKIAFAETGLSHGTLTAFVSGRAYEVTSFRTDGTYSDNRRPDSVRFVSDIRDDLSRRDFTINAMAYNKSEGVIDLFGGMTDLEKGLIRAVGDPDTRFEEDALRILRGLRFSSVLDFEIEDATLSSMLKKSPLLKNIARERITEELVKMLSGKGAPRVLEKYREIVFCMSVEFPQLLAVGMWEYAMKALELLPPSYDIRLAALILFLSQSVDIKKRSITAVDLTDIGTAVKLIGSFRLKSVSVRYIKSLLKNICTPEQCDRIGVKETLSRFGKVFYTDLLTLRRAVFGAVGNTQRCEIIDKTLKTVDDICQKREVFNISELDINGSDLKNLGYSGVKIGCTLEKILNLVMRGELTNDRESIIRYLIENE